jgi:hypothetical protein
MVDQSAFPSRASAVDSSRLGDWGASAYPSASTCSRSPVEGRVTHSDPNPTAMRLSASPPVSKVWVPEIQTWVLSCEFAVRVTWPR